MQQNIYLLDFQRVEGDGFSFMNLSAKVITELKTLSAASRQVQTNRQADRQTRGGQFLYVCCWCWCWGV